MKAIGIDIGTTSICGILFDTESGEILSSLSEKNGLFIESENDWEKVQNVSLICKAAKSLLDRLTALAADVFVIGITGQMHGIVYYNDKGEAVSNLYTWQDKRGDLLFKDGKTYSEYLNIPSGYGFVTDFYNREMGLVPKDAVGFCTIYDYLAMILTGNKEAFIHSSSAASFGGYDIKNKKFSWDFKGRITDDFEICGEYKGALVCCGIGDNQASVFGALKDETAMLLNIGTGSQISLISNEIKNGETFEARPYQKGEYLLAGAALCGGRAYAAVEKFYSDIVYAATGKRISMYEVMDKMPLSENVHITADTRFGGTRKNPEQKGGIYNITTENFIPGEFKEAVLRGIAEELFKMYEEMGQKREYLVGSGNGIRKNSHLKKAAEDIFKVKIKIPLYKEEAAFGAALGALWASGEFKDIKEVKSFIKYED